MKVNTGILILTERLECHAYKRIEVRATKRRRARIAGTFLFNTDDVVSPGLGLYLEIHRASVLKALDICRTTHVYYWYKPRV